MPQYQVWEKEYKKPKLITGSWEPQNEFKRFVKWLKKDRKVELENLCVLDLGFGTGKNAIFLAERGAEITGMEISDTAIKIAKERAIKIGLMVNVIEKKTWRANQPSNLGSNDSESPRNDKINYVNFLKADIGSPYPFKDKTFDLVLDIISSNSLNEAERKIYLEETGRILKPDGFFFVRALAMDGDKHATRLLKDYQEKEKDTYKMPEMNLIERVFSREDFQETYEKYFKIIKLELKSGYSKFKNRIYKRNYWISYLKKLS